MSKEKPTAQKVGQKVGKRDKRRAPSSSAVGPPVIVSQGGRMSFGLDDFWNNLSEDLNDVSPAVELLQKLGFGAEDQEWPSSSFGPVLPEVLAELKRTYQILTIRGFRIVDDPLNPSGNGRNWVLRCEPTNKLPNNLDPADLIDEYLGSEGVKVAAKPKQDGCALLVPLWDTGRVHPEQFNYKDSPRADETGSEVMACESTNLLRFVRRGDKTVAVDGYSHEDLRATYKQLIPQMKEIRAVVRSSKGKVAVAELERQFGKTRLGEAADPGDLKIWIDDFEKCSPRDRSAGVANHVLSFLSRKTGLKPNALRTYIKRAGAK